MLYVYDGKWDNLFSWRVPTCRMCLRGGYHRRYFRCLSTAAGSTIATSPDSEILHLCSLGRLAPAVRVIGSVGPGTLSSKPVVHASLLQACVKRLCFPLGVQLHAHVLKSGLDSDRFVGNSLLTLYLKLCPDIHTVRKTFDELPARDVVAWSSMVSGYIRAGKPRGAAELLKVMLSVDVELNAFTLSAGVKACTEMGDLRLGRCLHGMVLELGYTSNYVVSSSLIDMYGRNSSPNDALLVFREMTVPDAISWTSVISAFTRNDKFEKALDFFCTMQREAGLAPDGFTYGSVLTALGNLGRLRQGKQVHAMVITSGIRGNVVVDSSIVDMYAKCQSMRDSHQVFDRMTVKNAVSWCALLGGYSQNGDYNMVLKMFREMDKEDDNYSLSTVLRACSGLSDLRHGKEVHCHFLRTEGRSDVIVESALIDLYAKCGLVDYAYGIFENVSQKNLITWNAMICGFALNVKINDTIWLFDDMVTQGIQPDYISFIGVLFACSHAGLVNEGRKYFRLQKEQYGISPGVEHYNCMVDLLGRAGLLEEAECLIKESLFEDDSSLWASLLGACATYSDPVVAERVAKRMLKLDPSYHLSYVLLSNIYKNISRWDAASEILGKMKQKGIRKTEGRSWF